MLRVESLEENWELAPKDWSNFKILTGVLLSYWPKGTLKIVLLTRILRSQDKVLCIIATIVLPYLFVHYSNARVYVNQKTRIKRAKNRMLLRIKKTCASKNRAHKLDNSMYAVVLLFFYCWRFIVLKNRLQCYSTKVLNGYQQQANLFVSITVCTDLPDMLLPMRLRNQNI